MESKSSVEPAVKLRRGDYVSNPFKSAIQGIQLLWQNGQSAIWSVVAVIFFVCIALGVIFAVAIGSVLVSAFGIFADAVGGTGQAAAFLADFAPEPLELANALVYIKGAAISISVITIALLVILTNYIQALGLSYVGQSVISKQKADFKWIAGNAIKRMWPMLVQGLIIFGICFAALALPALVLLLIPNGNATVIALLGFYYFAVMISFYYILGRIALASYAVIIGNLGPWQALKYSWQITEDKVGEILGTLGVIIAVSFVTSMVLGTINDLIMGFEIPLVSISSFLVFVGASIAIAMVTSAPLAQRYAELENAFKTKVTDHKIAWGSIIGAIALAFGITIAAGIIQVATAPPLQDYSETGQPGDIPIDAELEAELQDLQNRVNNSEELPSGSDYDNLYQDYLNENTELPVNDEL